MDELPWHIGLAIVAALLFLNAIFVAAEFALVTVRRSRVHELAEDGSASARRVLTALGNLDYWVAASQLGITMASIALGFVGEPVLARLIEPPIEGVVGAFAPAVAHVVAIAIAFTLITALHIVIGEFVPKTIALDQPERTAQAVAVPMAVFVRVFGPAISVLNRTGLAILTLLGMPSKPIREAPLVAEDLAFTLESSLSAGLISRLEMDLARHALAIEATPATALMVPRNDLAALPLNAERKEVLILMAQHRHTRYPVYRDTIDDIVGLVDAKRVLLEADSTADWRRHMQPAVILPETIHIPEALERARERGTEVVILADEYGGTSGLMSLFDVTSYLAGQLPEEHDSRDLPYQRNPDGTIIMSGLARVLDIEEALNLQLPEEDVHTIGGLVLEQLGRIPAVGDEVALSGSTLRVTAMDRYRVDQVLYIPAGITPAPSARGGDRHER